jgi:hypothetical protein
VLQTTQLRPRISEVDVVEVELEVSVRKEVEATELCWLDDEEEVEVLRGCRDDKSADCVSCWRYGLAARRSSCVA